MPKFSDFNDLHQQSGLPAVRTQIESQLTSDTEQSKQEDQGIEDRGQVVKVDPAEQEATLEYKTMVFPKIEVLPCDWPEQLPHCPNKEGHPEATVVNNLLNHYRGRILQQNNFLFIYDGQGVWKLQKDVGVNLIKQQVSHVFNSPRAATSGKINSIYKHLLLKVPFPENGDVDLFTPPQTCANVLNGTLHLLKNEEGHEVPVLKPHDPKNYLINKLPMNYDETRTAKNDLFLNSLDKIFEGKKDKEDCIRVLAQLFGISLLPRYTRAAFFTGQPQTGKSTTIMLLMKLVTDNNLAGIQPHLLDSFDAVDMIGKLVNAVTDIATNVCVTDDMLKSVIDRKPVLYKQKHKDPIKTHLPPVHIWGCNALPWTREGLSRAYSRRMTILGFDNVIPPDPRFHSAQEFVEYVYKESPEGLLNFAVEGLMDLIESGGRFHQPQSSLRLLEDWYQENDVVSVFMSCMRAGEIVDDKTVLMEGETLRMPRTKFYDLYRKWSEEYSPRSPLLKNTQLYKHPMVAKYETIPLKGYPWMHGIGLGVRESADH